ncbi:MAG: membrane protein insertase YidC [Thermodesulfobacteriota bacterium]|nr:membrane protein insertase YidC [Thermodesulfobacteriota bacterium]
MEHIRLMLAVVLSVLVLLVWQVFFIGSPEAPVGPDGAPVAPAQEAAAPSNPAAGDAALPRENAPPEQAAPADSALVPTEAPAAPVVVETGLYTVTLNGNGAHISDFVLKNYRETNDPASPAKRLLSDNNPLGSLRVNLEGDTLAGMANGPYSADVADGPVVVSGQPRSVVFTRQFPGGRVVEKRYTFTPDSYMIDLAITLKNGSETPLSGNLAVTLARYFTDDGSRFVFEGPSALVGHDLEEIKLSDIHKKASLTGPLAWISIQNRYFMSALIPEAPTEAAMRLSRTPEQVVTATYLAPARTVGANSTETYRFSVFMGPKSVQILGKAGHDLDRAVNFGFFDFIARPCLWLMNFLYRYIPNYGIAIVIITLLFKLVFWPLGNKSYKSMAEMKRLAPLMAEIREKYKDDRKKMNEEVMNLYRTYKINPLGGCLPILVQIPVFFAFYRMLYQAIELRHAPFFGWINDLSAPDRLFHFDVSLPLIAPPVGIPVLTIVMGATMIIQQKLQPPMGDPTQAKIMMLMPVFFTFIFINFPSGLVLYWLVNNTISIFQQYYITRKNV